MGQGCYTPRSLRDPVYPTKTGSYFNSAARATFNYQNIGYIGRLGSLLKSMFSAENFIHIIHMQLVLIYL